MRSLPANFVACMNRRDGALPVCLLRFTAGGVDYLLDQDGIAVPPWNRSALPLIASWGQIQEGVTGTLDEIKMSDLQIDLINDLSANPNMRSLAKAKELAFIPVSIYLWFLDCTDPPQQIYSFRVRGIELPQDDTIVRLLLQDESCIYQNFSPGRLLSLDDYPEADPDDVGKIVPRPYGSPSRYPALAVDAGKTTSLPGLLSASATAFVVSDGRGFAAGMDIQVDDEQMHVNSVTGDNFTVTRATNSTVAAAHSMGAILWEQKGTFVYMAADYPIASLGKIYATVGQAEMDITSLVTKYAGGNHPSYPGKAVLTINGYITVAQAIDMMVHDGIDVTDASSVFDGIDVNNSLAISDLIAIGGAIKSEAPHTHQNDATSSQNATSSPISSSVASGNECAATASFPAYTPTRISVAYSITIQKNWAGNQTVTMMFGTTAARNDTTHRWYQDSVSISALAQGSSITYTFTITTTDRNLDYVYCYAYPSNAGYPTANFTVTAASRSISATPDTGSSNSNVTVTPAVRSGAVTQTGDVAKTGTVTYSSGVVKTGTVSLTGNSTANTVIGDAILVESISPITLPQDCLGDLLGTPCQLIGQFPAGYSFNGVMNTSKNVLDWCHLLAIQCRAYFRFVLGHPTLIVRPDTPASAKSIAMCRLSSGQRVHSETQTVVDDLINVMNLCFDRDWTASGSDSSAYRQVWKNTDAASIAAQGSHERSELFMCDFITTTAMASSVGAFYLARYAWQRWIHTQQVYLSESALEFGDWATQDFLNGELCEIVNMGFQPGKLGEISYINLISFE